MESVIAALIAVTGVAIGALLQFILSRAADARKSLNELRTSAYLDYLQAISDSATATKNDVKLDAISRATFAKTRITVIGSAVTVRALKDQAQYLVFDSVEAETAFANLCNAMRADVVGKRQIVDTKTVNAILFRRK